MISVSWNRWISNERVKEFVFSNIPYVLPERIWRVIDEAFTAIWNEQLLYNDWFHRDDLNEWIYTELKANKILMPVSQMDEIVTLILICIDQNRDGGIESDESQARSRFRYPHSRGYEVGEGSE